MFGWTDDHRPLVLLPVLMPCLTLEAFIRQVGTARRRPDTGQGGLRRIPHGEKGLRQRLILGAAGAKAKAGNHPPWRDRQQQVKALIPA